MSAKLSVIVLAWNQLDLTRRCVASIRESTDVEYELIIVDNGSEPESRAFAETASDTSVLLPENLGFARGMNAGLQMARGEFVAFVNNDTKMPPNWASRLVDNFSRFPRAGIVVPAVTASGNQISVRAEPGERVITLRRFIDLPSGVVYLMRTDTARAVGGWDERYGLASREDLDLLFTIWCNDLAVILDERVVVHHELNATAGSQLPQRDDLWAENWDIFIKKWSTGDPSEIPRTPEVDPAKIEANAQIAAVAAHWMDRWHTSWTSERTLRAELKETRDQRSPAPANRWKRFKRLATRAFREF